MRTNAFEAGISASVLHNKPDTAGRDDYDTYYIGGYAGKRVTLAKDGIFSYGVIGNYDVYGDSADATADGCSTEPMTIGAYTGLAYMPNKNFEVFTRTMPLSYERKDEGQVEIEFISEGAMGIKYFFSK